MSCDFTGWSTLALEQAIKGYPESKDVELELLRRKAEEAKRKQDKPQNDGGK